MDAVVYVGSIIAGSIIGSEISSRAARMLLSELDLAPETVQAASITGAMSGAAAGALGGAVAADRLLDNDQK